MNPYAPPKAPRETPRRDPRAVRRRSELLPIEGRVRAIAIVVGVVGLVHVASIMQQSPDLVRACVTPSRMMEFHQAAETGYHAMGAALCLVSAGFLYRLHARGRAGLTAWFVVGLTVAVLLWAAFRALPITLVLLRATMTAGILGYLHYYEGAQVLDEKHRALIDETPEIAAPISNWTIVLIVAIGFAINLLVH